MKTTSQKKPPVKNAYLGLFIPSAMKLSLSSAAVKDERTVTQVVRLAIKEYLEKHNGSN